MLHDLGIALVQIADVTLESECVAEKINRARRFGIAKIGDDLMSHWLFLREFSRGAPRGLVNLRRAFRRRRDAGHSPGVDAVVVGLRLPQAVLHHQLDLVGLASKGDQATEIRQGSQAWPGRKRVAGF